MENLYQISEPLNASDYFETSDPELIWTCQSVGYIT